MVQRRNAPQSNPQLPPERAVPILEGLIARAEQLRGEPPHSALRQEFEQTGEGALIAALGGASPTVQAFCTAQCSLSHRDDSLQVQMHRANTELEGMVAAIKSGVDQLRWRLPDPKQIFLPAGSSHDAYVEIRKVLSSVTTEIVIVDTYVDGTLWTLLTNIPSSAKIKIMTMQMKGDFALEAKKFSAQHGNAIEIRKTHDYHDRFVLVDNKKCWHLGASIKDAGNKAFAMSEIGSPAILRAIISDVQTTWGAAVPIPI